MVEVLRTMRPTARVEHKCQTCSGIIKPGERYERQVCAYDGRVYDWVTCPECIALFSLVWDWVGCDDARTDGAGMGVPARESGQWADHLSLRLRPLPFVRRCSLVMRRPAIGRFREERWLSSCT